jgi:hypothetical protein
MKAPRETTNEGKERRMIRFSVEDGGSMDAQTAVTAVMLEFRQGVCVECIARKTETVPATVHATFQRLVGSVRVVAFQGCCGVCSKRKTIIALARSPFVVGDLVTSRPHRDWSGEVVDTDRIENGYVSVRWRSLSGVLLEAVEEPIEGLVLHGRLGLNQRATASMQGK